jgi:hypothetical protein
VEETKPTVNEVVSALVVDPTLAYLVVRELSETTIAGPWEQGQGIENGYEKTFIRRHISGVSNVACVGDTNGSAVWWTPWNEHLDFAGSLLLARVAADAYLREHGWVLSDRGIALPWEATGYCWVRRSHATRIVVARAWGDQTRGRFETEHFGLSEDPRGIQWKADGLVSLNHAKALADDLLVDQGWVLGSE